MASIDNGGLILAMLFWGGAGALSLLKTVGFLDASWWFVLAPIWVPWAILSVFGLLYVLLLSCASRMDPINPNERRA